MPLSVGDRLGPYEILAPIGAGGMGQVWKARDTRLGRVVAIKHMKGGHTARFEQEARAIAALNHPHICTLYDVGRDYLVMEYIEGAALRGPLVLEEAVRLALQIAGALEAAHAKGILHRDLKPANILTCASGAKLLDFGLVKWTADSDATQTMDVMGTPLYMSPEQAEGKALDARSDVFAFGAVLYEMLAGRRAFDSLAAVIRDEPAPLASPAFAVVRRCLAKEPGQRFQSIAEVRQALQTLSANPPGQPSIAVLPFANLSADPEQEYFSDGLAEEIINALVQVPGLKVIARTSAFAFKGQNTDIRRIAETLGVAHVLEGSVRKAGNRVRVTAQLITAADGSHLWSQRYDRDLVDLFAVQDDIAEAITAALRLKLTAAPKVHAPHPAAHEALLKGRYHLFKLTPDSMALSHEYLKTAVGIDPEYAAAHAWLSEYYFGLVAGAGVIAGEDSERLARAAALRAVELDPSTPEAHAVLCGMAAVLDHDWVEAERRYLLATAGGAVPPEARRVCAFNYLLSAGRPQEAARQLLLALRDDPLNSFIAMQLGVCLHAAGESDQALERFRQAVELDERNFLAYVNQGFWFAERGDLQNAAEAFEAAYAIAPMNPIVTGLKAGILRLLGDEPSADALLARLKSGDEWLPLLGLWSHYTLIQDLENAAECAARGIRQRVGSITFALQFAFASGLRSSPHWPKLAKMMNLPGTAPSLPS